MTSPLPYQEPWTDPETWGMPIKTERLILRPWELEDIDIQYALIKENQDFLSDWLPWAESYSRSNATSFITTIVSERNSKNIPTSLPLAVVWRETGEIIGANGLVSIDPNSAKAEIGYWVKHDFANIGVTTEAVSALTTQCLLPQDQGGWGLNRIEIVHAGSNTPSGKVPRKLGFRREGWLRQAMTIGRGRRDDKIIWAVLAEEWDFEEGRTKHNKPRPDVGVGPHEKPWPSGDQYDERLLEHGDQRNVADEYRYWTMEAIREDIAKKAQPFHVAVENWQHDMNIGTVVRCANAFGARAVHIVGRRSWNRRGAMVTDRYLEILYHENAEELANWCRERDISIVGVDLVPGSVNILETKMPRESMLVFGQEGPGLTQDLIDVADMVVHLPQQGSTRSINAGVAAGTAMMIWHSQHD